MNNNIIQDRGITTLLNSTTSDPSFDLDETTRRLELLTYYQYSYSNNLIPKTGEYSRKSLIIKYYLHIGVTGQTTSEQHMLRWLNTQLSSNHTSLYNAWLAYFKKHETLPDFKGVRYGKVSVEAGYRKYLQDHVGAGFGYIELLQITDRLGIKLTRKFSDAAIIRDALTYLKKRNIAFNENLSLSDNFITQLRKQLRDGVRLNDALTSVLLKISLKDRLLIRDNFTVAGQNLAALFAFIDTLRLKEKVKWKLMRRIANETVRLRDTTLWKQLYQLNTQMTLSDILTFTKKIVIEFSSSMIIEDVLTDNSPSRSLSFTDEIVIRETFGYLLTPTVSEGTNTYGSNNYNSGSYND